MSTLKGTLLKIKLGFTYSQSDLVNLDTIDWYVEFYTKGKKVKLTKSECVKIDDDWYAYVDTAQTGSGTLRMRMMAYVPDEDAPEDIRAEYAEVISNIIIE